MNQTYAKLVTRWKYAQSKTVTCVWAHENILSPTVPWYMYTVMHHKEPMYTWWL